MTRLTRAAALAVASLLTLPVLLLGAATPAAAGLPVVAKGNIGITYDATSFRVCAEGYVDDGSQIVGEWLWEIDGARSDGQPIRGTVLVGGDTFAERCQTIPKGATAHGAFVTSLTFAGAGTSDFAVVAGGDGFWTVTGNHADSFGF